MQPFLILNFLPTFRQIIDSFNWMRFKLNKVGNNILILLFLKTYSFSNFYKKDW